MYELRKKYLREILDEFEKVAEWYNKKYGQDLNVQVGTDQKGNLNVFVRFMTPDEKGHVCPLQVPVHRMDDLVWLIRTRNTVAEKLKTAIDKKWFRHRPQEVA